MSEFENPRESGSSEVVADKRNTLPSENPVEWIPPEVWEMVIENINSSKDLVNLVQVIPSCAKVIFPKRVEWLFYQVLPVLVTNLFGTHDIPYRNEFLKCRLVCKHWKFGWDNFVQNNALHYPASGDNVDCKLERCHYAETFYFIRADILGCELKPENLQKMIDEASNHPNNPIVGGYIHILVPKEEDGVALVERFFVLFGRHIHYLELHLSYDSCPHSNLLMLTQILPNLHNLKGLAIDKYNSTEIEEVSKRSVNTRKQKLNKVYKEVISTDFFRQGLLKIETLHLNIQDICGDILSQMILNMFSLEQLKSLIIFEYFVPAQITTKMSNLLYLRLKIKKHEQLKSLLKLDCPLVRKLELNVEFDELDYEVLCKVLQKFQNQLKHLTLILPDPEENVDVTKVAVKNMTDFFTKSDKLKMTYIKSLTLIGYCPLSFNFMCGDGFKSLEYLHLYLDGKHNDGPENSFFYLPTSSTSVNLLDAEHSEESDLIEKIGTNWA